MLNLTGRHCLVHEWCYRWPMPGTVKLSRVTQPKYHPDSAIKSQGLQLLQLAGRLLIGFCHVSVKRVDESDLN